MILHRSLFIAVVALAAALSGCTASESEDGPELVRMTDDLEFDPQELEVTPGTEVVWRNVGKLPHTVTSDDGEGPLDSGNIAGAEDYRYTFDEPGIYPYHCEPHASQNDQGEYEGMIGTIIVLNEDGSRPTADDNSTA